jgi:hypothetical protein
MLLIRLFAVGFAALAVCGCAVGERSADQRWADHVCTAMGDWSTDTGAIGAEMITWRDEGDLTPGRIVSALRDGLKANSRLRTAVKEAGPAPVSDGASLYAQLNVMVAAGTAHIRRAYRIAARAEASNVDAYSEVQEQLQLADHAFDNRGVIIFRWYDLESCANNT